MEDEMSEQDGLGSGSMRQFGLQMFDRETLKRRQEIYEKINQRRKMSQQGVTSNKQVTYN
jgi:hypothetical protein